MRGLRRLDSETDRVRVINAAFAFLKSARYVNTAVRVSQNSGVTWLPSEELR